MTTVIKYNEKYTYKHENCYHCQGFYGKCFDEPLCSTCHAFLCPPDPFRANRPILLCDKVDECDSGNEEPRDSQQDCVQPRVIPLGNKCRLYKYPSMAAVATSAGHANDDACASDQDEETPGAASISVSTTRTVADVTSVMTEIGIRDAALRTAVQTIQGDGCTYGAVGYAAGNNVDAVGATAESSSSDADQETSRAHKSRFVKKMRKKNKVKKNTFCHFAVQENLESSSGNHNVLSSTTASSINLPPNLPIHGGMHQNISQIVSPNSNNSTSNNSIFNSSRVEACTRPLFESHANIGYNNTNGGSHNTLGNREEDNAVAGTSNDANISTAADSDSATQLLTSFRMRLLKDGNNTSGTTNSNTSGSNSCRCDSTSSLLQERLCLLTNHRRYNDTLPSKLANRMPPEVWVLVFRLLDDASLWQCSRVCVAWRELVLRNWGHDDWRRFTLRRWRFFKPLFYPSHWHALYTSLMEASPCKPCQVQMFQPLDPRTLQDENSWRMTRLHNEIKNLSCDPPEGIEAVPLDPHSLHWQAAIRGPDQSPYQGGTFYLHILIPPRYPLGPPRVRFLTRIFHPNISCHGDIGIDSIHHNWSLALTISKVLISIQSLLTDPYTKVCMEPRAAHLYDNERAKFDQVAMEWTWRYAMTDTLQPTPSRDELSLCEAITGPFEDPRLGNLSPLPGGAGDEDLEDLDNNDPENNDADNNDPDNNDVENNDQDNIDMENNDLDNNDLNNDGENNEVDNHDEDKNVAANID